VAGGTLGLLLQADTAFIFTFAGGTASFVLSYVTVPQRVSVGVSSTIIGASLWGGLEGMATTLLFSDHPDLVAPITLASSALFAAGGALTAERLRLSDGDAALINSGALWGAVTGVLTWKAFTSETEPLDGLGPPLALGGVNVGLLAGVSLARRFELGRSHVALIDLSAVTGMLVGLGTALVVPDEAQRGRESNFMLGGLMVGLVVGTILTRNFDETGDLPRLAGRWHPLLGRTDQGETTLGVAGSF
jgi:hypothetical protein